MHWHFLLSIYYKEATEEMQNYLKEQQNDHTETNKLPQRNEKPQGDTKATQRDVKQPQGMQILQRDEE